MTFSRDSSLKLLERPSVLLWENSLFFISFLLCLFFIPQAQKVDCIPQVIAHYH